MIVGICGAGAESGPMRYCKLCRSPEGEHDPETMGCPVMTKADGSILYGPIRFSSEEGRAQDASADEKLRRIERIASSADWQARAMTPTLFSRFCNEILMVVDIDGMDGITGGGGGP